MIAKKILFTMVAVTTLTFSISYWVIQEYWIGVTAFFVGISWLTLEIRNKSPFPSLFFVTFIGLAILASLESISPLIILLGLSTDLAAWDLSRFLSRVRKISELDVKPGLFKKHLHKLAVTLCIGYTLAILPVFIRFELNFVALFGLTLLAMITLRRSILYFRDQGKSEVSE